MPALTNSMVYSITAWKDNKVKICLTQGEGTTANSPTNHKTIKFKLYDSDGGLLIPSSTIQLAVIRPNNTEDLLSGVVIDGGNSIIGFDVKPSLTEFAGNAKAEIRIIVDNSVVKFPGINFVIFDGVSDSAASQSTQFSALIEALQSVQALTAGGEIATLDTVIAHNGINPVASGIIYDYLTSNYYNKTQADTRFEAVSNKTRDISSSKTTVTADNYNYPSVAGLKDFTFGNFYTKGEIDEEGFLTHVPVLYMGTTDKSATESITEDEQSLFIGDVYINKNSGNIYTVTNVTEDNDGYTYRWTLKGCAFTAVKPTSISYTLDSDDWDNGEQTLTISGYTVTNKTKIDVDFNSTIANTLYNMGCIGLYIENDNGVVTCKTIGDTPDDDITIQLTLVEVN